MKPGDMTSEGLDTLNLGSGRIGPGKVLPQQFTVLGWSKKLCKGKVNEAYAGKRNEANMGEV